MILKVLADSLGSLHDVDSLAAQKRGRTNPGQLQELRRVNGTGGQYDLAPGKGSLAQTVLAICDALRTLALENDACGLSVRLDPQTGSRSRRPDVCARARHAHTVLHRVLIGADSLLRRAVEVRVVTKLELLASVDEILTKGVQIAIHRGYVDRPVTPTVGVASTIVGLGFSEVWQDIVPSPAWVAQILPVFEVLPLAAYVDHRIDGARTSHDLAPRPVGDAAVQAGVRFRLVHPVQAASVEGLAISDRHPNPEVQVAAACL